MPILMLGQPTPDPSKEGIDWRARLRFMTGKIPGGWVRNFPEG